MMLVIALIGRNNVGKSTIFNRLTRTHDALVSDFPGLTRDRKYGYAEIDGKKFICIDTGGINSFKKEIDDCIIKQSFLAIKEADIVLFIVDAKSGLMPEDLIIAKYLRSCGRVVFLVVNKTDNIDVDQAVANFRKLGFNKIYPIVAFHNRDVSNLLKIIFVSPFIKTINLEKKVNKNYEFLAQLRTEIKEVKNNVHLKVLPIKLAIVGRPNVGKSTLTNRILGENQVIISDIAGTTRDNVYIPVQYNKRQYLLIDTAGVRKRKKIKDIIEKFCVTKTLQSILYANVVILIIDAKEGIFDQDISLLHFILNSGRSLVIVANKCDNLKRQVKEKIKETFSYRFKFVNFVHIHFISALNGKGIKGLFKSICKSYDSSNCHISSAMLTRIMNIAIKNQKPPLINGHSIKLKYAHVGGYNPLIVVIHGNRVKNLSNSYKRYLINFFHKSLGIIGSPIRIQLREGFNPYYNKCNLIK